MCNGPQTTGLISVVIPVHNGRAFIRRAIDSVRSQSVIHTGGGIELIVVDDGSTDGTGAFVRALLQDDPHAVLVELKENAGPGAARNIGFDRATGEWIAILDADDYYLPDRLERLVGYAVAHHLDFVADSLLVSYIPEGEVPAASRGSGGEPMRWNFYEHFANDYPGIDIPYGLLKPVFSRAFLQKAGKRYNENYRNGEDFHFYAELFLAGARARILPYRGYMYLSLYCTYQHGRASITGSLSRPTRDPGTLIEQSDDFLVRHGPVLTPLQRNLVQVRRKRLWQSKQLYDLKRSLSAGHFGAAAARIARYPHLWKDILRFLWRLARQARLVRRSVLTVSSPKS